MKGLLKNNFMGVLENIKILIPSVPDKLVSPMYLLLNIELLFDAFQTVPLVLHI